ncbi:MAG: fibrobacter succinogenes major paralogous domain-containing protein [Rikenellaceae bacterium]|nr:fibrobacter succinogenes major paralogous domain-containing protein [Rikenellaceae bacterium]MCL2692383.1 fibrobacter succinogenes major paralogous domain-containing protein [Rikenellaceae bacterium]
MNKISALAIMMFAVVACSKNNDGSKEANQEEQGVTIAGVTWATRNVDRAGKFVARPENFGQSFTFNEAQTACPEGWRLPTVAEFQSLLKAWGSVVTKVNGIGGRRFGSIDNAVFFPVVSRYTAAGVYWSSSVDPENEFQGGILFFNNDDSEGEAGVYISFLSKSFAWKVRCVKK